MAGKAPSTAPVTTSPVELEVTKVNNASLIELKNACDDALKRVRG
jgi:hypothetical protein